ncbi:MAG: hypothetical protein XXXJIFNMEKO3_LKCDNKCA_00101 (plasmid) [Candidatus Erwinia impunctatus]
MSQFIRGDCVRIMSGLPDKAVNLILTDPPYLVGFRDRQRRTIAGDKQMNGYNLPAVRCIAC